VPAPITIGATKNATRSTIPASSAEAGQMRAALDQHIAPSAPPQVAHRGAQV
jgi:hypothetical protein